ncbi:DNA-binding transcriptional regulator, MarR family [Actinacidiphila yanglinensis]|uniref:DNA-binding transcriptional regulator, MarR family n=1 Tax=Actinacidiphila yanglinensis TaxID=310779 RepID=A0A1H6CA35_9ACTN|nr:MarR family transcriptional regulator [Actinacidiphila yanglinensis]SEG69753.1 DNA-binding transcriptional regulator, MarR family [Actinacidiphila yanglinensis]
MPDDASTPALSAPEPGTREPGTPAPGSPEPASGDLGIADGLAQLSFLVQGVLGEVAAEHGLSVVQLRLLGVLRDRKPGMQELARHLGLDKSSMTGLVDRAERRGLVRRAPSPRDGRAVLVSLTEDGHALAREGAAEAGHRIRALAAHLTGDQRARLSSLATALVAGHSAL